MTEQLKFWKNLTKEEKQEIKIKYNIKVVTYEFIENLYLESKQITDNFELDEKD